MADRGGYDIVILGGGSGGYACALRAAELGQRVALIEKGKVGGTCLHRGCIPTKALLHAAEVADQARESTTFGVKATFDGIEMAGVNAYKDKVVTRLWKGLTGLIGSRHIDIIEGEGRLVSPTQVQVGDTLLEGAHVVLASGSESRSLPGLEIDGQRVITSDQALELDRVPASVIILGGGVIGVEFASVWRSFGADVTIVEMLPHLVPTEDEASSKLLERAFRRRGINYKLGAKFEGVKDSDSGVTVTLEGGSTLDAELMLVAVGRGPVSAGLGYEDAGVALQRGYVTVDEYCQTSVPTISAVGDLIPGPQLAHVGFAEGIMVAERLSGLPVTPIDYDGVPRPADGGRGQGHRHRGRRPGARRPPGGRPGRRADRRGPADLQLGGRAVRGRPAYPSAPNPVRNDRRGAPGARWQAPPLPPMTGPLPCRACAAVSHAQCVKTESA